MNPTPAGEAFQQNGVWYQDYNVQDPVTGQIVVKRYMHDGTNWVEAPVTQTSKIDLTKNIPDTPAGISLKKNVINLDKCLINLSKSSGINLGNHRAKVAAVIDYSGSMSHLYSSGAVQRALNRLIPLGLRFDDNGEVDVWLFHDYYKRLEGIDLRNFEHYVDEVMLGSGERYGGTCYAPVIRDLIQKYTVEDPSEMPTFVIFITDGDNSDKARTNEMVKDSSYHKMFIQFVGIGGSSFRYLEKLDDLTGRPVDNTGFIKVKDFDRLSDDELYTELLDQYVQWLKEMHLN